MHLHLPIEQLVQRVGTAFQFGFATEAKELLPEGEEFLLNASHRGLHVLARNEEALALPRDVLLDVYGPSLRIDAPRVRLIEGVQLRSRSCTCAGAALARASSTRERPIVCCYEVPLADLLGLPAELRQLTEGRAKQSVALSHYAIVTRDPGGKAA
jgi:hypothetical protein